MKDVAQRTAVAVLLSLLAVISAPALSHAQTAVAVLGVRSVEGDDEFARNLTGALRRAASQVEGWAISDREVTLAQMSLAFGCDQPDPVCLAQIAESLGAERVIYGEVRRSSTGQTYDFSMNLHLFNAQSGEVEQSVADTIPGVRRDIDDLREPVRRYVAALTGAPRVGSLVVSVNVPGAEVFVDDEPVGVADSDGRLSLPNVPVGNRRVRIVAPGHQSFSSTISIEAHSEATFEAQLETSSGSQPIDPGQRTGGGVNGEVVLGASMLVVAAGLAAAWIGSWAHIQFNLQEQDGYQQYREDASRYVLMQDPSADPRRYNVCQYAQNDDAGVRQLRRMEGSMLVVGTQSDEQARSVCSEADAFEVLQFAFGIGAGVIGGLGLYFLIHGLSADSDPSEQAFELTPSIGPDHAYLNFRTRF